MNYKNHSISLSSYSYFSYYCSICTTFTKGSILWLQASLYARYNNYHGRYIKIINSLIHHNSRNSAKYSITFRDVMMMANDREPYNFYFKDWDQVKLEIKQSIIANIHLHYHYDKLYFGKRYGGVMLSYQIRKKAILEKRQSAKSQSKQKFTIINVNNNNNKSALSSNNSDNNKILEDSTLNRKYDFIHPDVFESQKTKSSKHYNSLFEIEKLKKNLSIMIEYLKVNEYSYPQINNIHKPYIDFIKSKYYLKFRKSLENNISEIHYDKNRNNKLKKSQNNLRLYTSPDPQDDLYTEHKYVEAYGFLMQQNPYLRKKKKKSLLRKEVSRYKSATNLSRTKLTAYTKSSRQATYQGSQLMISATNSSSTNLRKSKSKSRLGTGSKNKILLMNSTSKNKLRSSGTNNNNMIVREKSLNNNKSRKLLMQYKG